MIEFEPVRLPLSNVQVFAGDKIGNPAQRAGCTSPVAVAALPGAGSRGALVCCRAGRVRCLAWLR